MRSMSQKRKLSWGLLPMTKKRPSEVRRKLNIHSKERNGGKKSRQLELYQDCEAGLSTGHNRCKKGCEKG